MLLIVRSAPSRASSMSFAPGRSNCHILRQFRGAREHRQTLTNPRTQKESVAECIGLARDAISLWRICEQDMGKEIPAASNLTPVHSPEQIVTLVDVDFDAYRRANDMRAIWKNVTIPSYLNEMDEKAEVNFSQVLQESLKQHLGIQQLFLCRLGWGGFLRFMAGPAFIVPRGRL